MYEPDIEKILDNFNNMNKHIEYIKGKNIESTEQLKKSQDLYYAISMALFTLLNKFIEVGEELVESLDKSYFPRKYTEIPKILFEEKVISANQYKLFKDFIIYRNSIAHEYDEIKENEIYWCIKNIDYVTEIMKLAKNRLLNEK